MNEEELQQEVENLKYKNAILHFENIDLRRKEAATHKICSLLVERLRKNLEQRGSRCPLLRLYFK